MTQDSILACGVAARSLPLTYRAPRRFARCVAKTDSGSGDGRAMMTMFENSNNAKA